jgi:hypothetical protein
MFVETTTNEYGTAVDAYRCETCNEPFTVCPANEDRSRDDKPAHDLWQRLASESAA